MTDTSKHTSKEARRVHDEVLADTDDEMLAAEAAEMMDDAWAEMEL